MEEDELLSWKVEGMETVLNSKFQIPLGVEVVVEEAAADMSTGSCSALVGPHH